MPCYPSAMTATAGVSNVSLVMSASRGCTNGTRAAHWAPHRLTYRPTTQPAMLSHNQLPSYSLSNGIIARPPLNLASNPSSRRPTSSATMAWAAVPMATADARQQQQQYIRHLPANAVSALTVPRAAPTPSIPVPNRHARLYYVTTSPLSHMSSPPLASNNSAHWTHLTPTLVAIPTTSATGDRWMAASYALIPALPVGIAFRAVTTTASVDAFYHMALHLQSGNADQTRGLSADELQSLPVRTYSAKPDRLNASMEELDRSDDRCMICLDDYEVTDKLRQMRCRHEFHADCIDQWLKVSTLHGFYVTYFRGILTFLALLINSLAICVSRLHL